jgi:hypothetical protein
MSIQIFCFTINPHELILLLPDGTQLNRIQVDGEAEAKELLQGEAVNQSIIEKLGTPDFSTLWIDDPAGNPEVVEACRLMEEKLAAARAAVSDPSPLGVISVHTKGVVFEEPSDSTDETGAFQLVDIETLGIGDVCRFTAEGQEPSGIYEVVATAIHSGDEDSGDFTIQLKAVEPAPEESKPQFASAGHGKKIIEVECEVSASEQELRRLILDMQNLEISEQELRRLIRDMENLEIQANASAADYREQIKAAKKRIYDLSNGKAYTLMECDITNDWEGGKRTFTRPDTGAVVRVEDISQEERQLNMLPELDAATPEVADDDTDATTAEGVADQPEGEVVAPPETDNDFVPPEGADKAD